jgi:zinc protease
VQGVVKREVRSGSEDKSTISLTFTGTGEYTEPEQLRVAALIEVMNLRIIDVLREKLTLIYGGGMSGGLAKIPYGHYSINATFPTAPANTNKVIDATFAEIERLKNQGPDAGELEKVKRNWIDGHRKALRENGYWLSNLQSSLTEETDPASILRFEKQVEAISPDDIKSAARRYFDTANYVQVVLLPEKAPAKIATAAP